MVFSRVHLLFIPPHYATGSRWGWAYFAACVQRHDGGDTQLTAPTYCPDNYVCSAAHPFNDNRHAESEVITPPDDAAL